MVKPDAWNFHIIEFWLREGIISQASNMIHSSLIVLSISLTISTDARSYHLVAERSSSVQPPIVGPVDCFFNCDCPAGEIWSIIRQECVPLTVDDEDYYYDLNNTTTTEDTENTTTTASPTFLLTTRRDTNNVVCKNCFR